MCVEAKGCEMGWNTLALWVGYHVVMSYYLYSFNVSLPLSMGWPIEVVAILAPTRALFEKQYKDNTTDFK